MQILANLTHEEQVAYWRDTVRGELVAEIERLTKERDFARDAVAQKCRQYDADMKTMQDALNREIEARRALEQSPPRKCCWEVTLLTIAK